MKDEEYIYDNLRILRMKEVEIELLVGQYS